MALPFGNLAPIPKMLADQRLEVTVLSLLNLSTLAKARSSWSGVCRPVLASVVVVGVPEVLIEVAIAVSTGVRLAVMAVVTI